MAFAKKRIRIICPKGGSKILFPSRESAEAYLTDVKKRTHSGSFKPVRIYYCDACGGYHTTTSTESRLSRMSPKARAETVRLRQMRNSAPAELQAMKVTDIPPKENLRRSLKPHNDAVLVGRIYRHFKGDYYQVLAIAHHTETHESLVIYQLLYHKKKRVRARPYADFISEVDHQKYPLILQRYRFELQELKRKKF